MFGVERTPRFVPLVMSGPNANSTRPCAGHRADLPVRWDLARSGFCAPAAPMSASRPGPVDRSAQPSGQGHRESMLGDGDPAHVAALAPAPATPTPRRSASRDGRRLDGRRNRCGCGRRGRRRRGCRCRGRRPHAAATRSECRDGHEAAGAGADRRSHTVEGPRSRLERMRRLDAGRELMRTSPLRPAPDGPVGSDRPSRRSGA